MFAVAIALVACGDDALETTVAFRLHGPPPAGFDGRCPESSETTPILSEPSAVRLTYRRSGGGLLVCDAVLDYGVPNQVVAVPVEPGQRVDVFAELYRDDGAGGVALIGTGATRGVELSQPDEIRIFVTPREEFACAPERGTVPRAFHTATALPNGAVLLAGGVTAMTADGTGLLLTNSLELYQNGDFRPLAAGSAVPRAFHSAVLLDDDGSGTVRVALYGGVTVSGDPATTPGLIAPADGVPLRLVPGPGAVGAPTEIVSYDPDAGTASILPVGTTDVTPRLFGSRGGPSATISAIAGGWVDAERATANTTLQGLDRATAAAAYSVNLLAARFGATLTEISPTRAILWGGHLDTPDVDAGALAGEVLELDGAAAITSIGFSDPAIPAPRAFHAAAAAGNGDLIIAGGFAIASGAANAPEPQFAERLRFGPVSLVTPMAPSEAPAVPAGYLDALALAGGDVLISGGNPTAAMCGAQEAELQCSIANAFRYRAASETLASLPALTVGRYGHASAQLGDDVVLVTGGLHAEDGELEVIGDAELFNPRAPDFDPVADLALGREAGEAIEPCPVLTAPEE